MRSKRLTRPWKTVRNMAVCTLLLYIAWSFAGYPMTSEAAFRRAERANFLDGLNIMTSVDTQMNGPHFTVADGGDKIVLWRDEGFWKNTAQNADLMIYDKQGDMTVITLPESIYGNISRGGSKSMALVFDNVPGATYAELTMTVDTVVEVDGKDIRINEIYHSSAERETDGLFMFIYEANTIGEGSTEEERAYKTGEQLVLESLRRGSYSNPAQNISPPRYEVAFFDSDGELIDRQIKS